MNSKNVLNIFSAKVKVPGGDQLLQTEATRSQGTKKSPHNQSRTPTLPMNSYDTIFYMALIVLKFFLKMIFLFYCAFCKLHISLLPQHPTDHEHPAHVTRTRSPPRPAPHVTE